MKGLSKLKKWEAAVMEDSKIIDLFWNKDENAIKETSFKYGAYCFTVANNILNNKEDSDECVNDTWLKVWNSIPPLRPARLKIYLAKITRNISINRYNARSAKKRGGGEITIVLDELSQCISCETDIVSEYEEKELRESIRSFVRTLPERDADVFVRRYFFTESVAEISERYKLTENNVTVILSRTRKKLKNHLIKEGFFNEQK